MTHLTPPQMTDAALTIALLDFAQGGRRTDVELIRHLAEFDARRLHLAAGFSSLFDYCVEELHLSEHETFHRIKAARASHEFPILLEALADGRVNLTTIRLLAPHLTVGNHRELLAAAVHKRKREVQALIASRFPQPDVATSIRKVPARSAQAASSSSQSVPTPAAVSAPTQNPAAAAARAASSPDSSLPAVFVPPPRLPPPRLPPPPRPATVAPLSSDRCEFRFTGPLSARDKLRQAQDLFRHAIPSGDVGQLFDRALTLLLAEGLRHKVAEVSAPRSTQRGGTDTRHIPAEVRRTVWRRDSGRCAFVGRGGRRCGATAHLEFHHVRPYAAGGPPTADNIALRCRAHNAYEADLFYGPMKAAAHVLGGRALGAVKDPRRDRLAPSPT